MTENEKPTTLLESFKTMSAASIRKVVIEAEAYLEAVALTATLAVLKAAIGQKLECVVAANRMEVLCVNVDTANIPQPQRWKVLGKFIATAGSLLERAGIPVSIDIKNVGGENPATLMSLTLLQIHPRFKEMLRNLAEDNETSIAAKDILTLFEVKEDPDAEDTE